MSEGHRPESVRLGVALAVRTALARHGRWLLALVVVLGLGVAAWLTLWTFRLTRALFLPGNLQIELHLVASGLLAVLGLDLVSRLVRLRRGVAPLLGLPGETVLPVSRLVVVGRNPGVWGVVVNAPMVSARHLELRPVDGALETRDLGSRNGSFVGGRDLREVGPVRLQPGETVELGRGGPCLRALQPPVRGTFPSRLFPFLLGLLAAIGLFLGWRANVEGLPVAPLVLPGGSVGFEAFRSWGPALMLFGLLGGLLLVWNVGLRRRHDPVLELVFRAVQVLLVVGIVTLYPLMPREGLRYGKAAERAGQSEAVGAERTGPETREGAARDRTVRRLEGLARTLAAPEGAPFWKVTFFRQALAALLGAALLLVLPLWSSGLRSRVRRLLEALSRPVWPGAVRTRLGPALHWDVLIGIAAGGLVLLVLLTPLGTSLGHGQRLWLKTPLGTVQSIELAKVLFVLFMAGYFGRIGRLMELVPRTRYLAPFVVASSLVLLATAVQADMGGLLMLALLVSLLFVLSTGVSRLLLAVPVLLGLGLGLAAALGRTATLQARLGLWLDPLHHPRGEQVVAGRQLLMSSGWTGFGPGHTLAWRIPDVHGDLTFAALGERFGLLGLLGFLAAWAVLVAGLLVLARRGRRPERRTEVLLLGGTAVLLALQLMTQAGGILGLMPFTGVPVPWLSQGLTATLVFTGLLGLALAGAPGEPDAGSPANPSPGLRRLRRGEWAILTAMVVVALAAAWWLVVLPGSGRYGEGGRAYRWIDPDRQAEVERLVTAGVFVPEGSHGGVRLDFEAWKRHLRRHPDDSRLDLARFVEGLHVKDGQIVPRLWLVSGSNPFAVRPLPRGWILGADGEVLAMNDRRGHRLQPLGKAAWHLVGEPRGRSAGWGIEARLGSVLQGASLPRSARIRAFASDIHHGADVRLTVIPEIQREAYRLLDGREGAAVVMRVDDGALVAVVSSPAPEPGASRASVLELPDRAIGFAHGYTPPGSTFKMVIAAAELQRRSMFGGGMKVRCTGYDPRLDVRCAHGAAHGRENLARALRDSCNVYFANLAVDLGGSAILREGRRFGFNPERPVDLLAGAGGEPWFVAPSTVEPGAARTDRDLARLGYGQGPVNATPLQMARVGATIASGGLLPVPYLVRSIELAEGEGRERRVVWSRKVRPPRPVRVLPRGVAHRLNHDLRAVFEDPRGTAHGLPGLWKGPEGWRLARQKPGDGWERVPVAGKTGSAWRRCRSVRDDAWMVAWAPADHPRFVTCVLVDDAGTGARIAGPIALELLRLSLERTKR